MNTPNITESQLDIVRKLKTLDAAGLCAADASMQHAYARLDLDLLLLALLAYRDEGGEATT